MLCTWEICLHHVSVPPKLAINKSPVYIIRKPLGCDRRLLYLCYQGICLNEWRKYTHNVSKVSPCHCQDSNWLPNNHKWNARLLDLRITQLLRGLIATRRKVILNSKCLRALEQTAKFEVRRTVLHAYSPFVQSTRQNVLPQFVQIRVLEGVGHLHNVRTQKKLFKSSYLKMYVNTHTGLMSH